MFAKIFLCLRTKFQNVFRNFVTWNEKYWMFLLLTVNFRHSRVSPPTSFSLQFVKLTKMYRSEQIHKNQFVVKKFFFYKTNRLKESLGRKWEGWWWIALLLSFQIKIVFWRGRWYASYFHINTKCCKRLTSDESIIIQKVLVIGSGDYFYTSVSLFRFFRTRKIITTYWNNFYHWQNVKNVFTHRKIRFFLDKLVVDTTTLFGRISWILLHTILLFLLEYRIVTILNQNKNVKKNILNAMFKSLLLQLMFILTATQWHNPLFRRYCRRSCSLVMNVFSRFLRD